MPVKTYRTSVREALAIARSELQSLVSDIRGVTDRGDTRLNGMARVQLLRNVADELDSLRIPEPLSVDADDVLKFQHYASGRKRGAARRDRRDNVSYALRAVLDHVHRRCDMGRLLPPEEETFTTTLETTISRLESVQFPRYYIKKEEIHGIAN